MVKQVRSSLEITDEFLVQRIDGSQKLVTGRDLQKFIEDSQERFTDDSEAAISELSEEAQENTQAIRDNDYQNRAEHRQFEEQIQRNAAEMADNRRELNALNKRVSKLEHDNRAFGYYSFAWIGLAQPEEDSPALPPPGTFIFLDENNEVTTDPEECAQVFFNKVDMSGRDRTFLGIYSGDSLELTFMYRVDGGYETDGRLSFRVLRSHDSAAQLGNDHIKVDVRLVNQYNPSFTYSVNNYNEDGEIEETITYSGLRMVDNTSWTTPYDSYVKCGAYPSQLVDDNVDVDILKTALLPQGAIQLWPTDDIPKGWLLCDGRTETQAKNGLTTGQQKQVAALFKNMGFSKLPEIAGRFPAGLTGNYNISGKGTHDFQKLLNSYWRRTGNPRDNSNKDTKVELNSGGAHRHPVSISHNDGHKHKYGSSNNATSGNSNNVYDARNRHGSYETDSTGDHSHNLSINKYNTNHNHDISGFNNDHRPHTIAYNYIIKYTT